MFKIASATYVLGSHLNYSICVFGMIQACAAPKNKAKSLRWSSEDHNGRLWSMVLTKITSNKHMLSFRSDPKTHVALAILKIDFRPRQQC